MGKLVLFRYNIIDREYCNDIHEVYADIDSTIVYGFKNIRIWNDYPKGFIEEKAFFISYNGVEYGSKVQDSFKYINPCGDPVDDFMIFDEFFENVFE